MYPGVRGVDSVILSPSGTMHMGDGGVKCKWRFLSKQGPLLPSQDTMQVWGHVAEEIKAAGPRTCIALPDIAIFFFESLLLCQTVGIFLAFFQKTPVYLV